MTPCKEPHSGVRLRGPSGPDDNGLNGLISLQGRLKQGQQQISHRGCGFANRNHQNTMKFPQVVDQFPDLKGLVLTPDTSPHRLCNAQMLKRIEKKVLRRFQARSWAFVAKRLQGSRVNSFLPTRVKNHSSSSYAEHIRCNDHPWVSSGEQTTEVLRTSERRLVGAL